MENLRNSGSSMKNSPKNAEMQFVTAPMLKSLKMGLESSDWCIYRVSELEISILKLMDSPETKNALMNAPKIKILIM